MLSYLRISVPLSQAKVNYVYIMLTFANTNKKIIRLNISMQEQPRVNVLYSLNHLVSQH